MRIEGPQEQPVVDEFEVLQRLLPLSDATLLDLGCGAAEKTKEIADRSDVREIVAAEVDDVQHRKNLASPIPKVTFKSYGAEKIEEDDDRFDIVVMFKSLHHVPVALMAPALREIKRVLKPGGLAYISEPVFSGNFNEVLRLFHDEREVRRSAFDTIGSMVDQGEFNLVDEVFFLTEVRMKSFDQFEHRVINVTHTRHALSDELMATVRAKFLSFEGDSGFVFQTPNRVDLLQKPSRSEDS